MASNVIANRSKWDESVKLAEKYDVAKGKRNQLAGFSFGFIFFYCFNVIVFASINDGPLSRLVHGFRHLANIIIFFWQFHQLFGPTFARKRM